MSNREPGKTERQLAECIGYANAGQSTDFVVDCPKQLKYAKQLCAYICAPDKFDGNDLHYGKGRIRISSLHSSPQRLFGCSARLVFDHGVEIKYLPRARQIEWSMLAWARLVELPGNVLVTAGSTHSAPENAGHYWAKLVTPCDMPEGEDWASTDWEVVQVFDNNVQGQDKWRVSVCGIEPSQQLNAFLWGPKVKQFKSEQRST